MAKFPKIPGGLGSVFNKALEDVQAAEQELNDARIVGTSPGGHVTVTANGMCKIISVKIAPEAVDPNDVETLEDLIAKAVDEAVETASRLRQQRLNSALPVNFGGLGGML
ncbi:MAG: YbaB/EbfC family nucleoid-associated protein [Capsulimonadaceae bacterium]